MLSTNSGVVPSLSDIAAVTDNNSDGMWGNGGWWIIVILALLFWNGNGNFGGNGGNGFIPYAMMGSDTNHIDASIQRGFDNAAVTSQLGTITSDICQGFANTNMGVQTGFMNLNTQLCGSFDGVNSNINNLGFNLQNSLLQVSNLIDGIKYENAQNTANVIQAGNDNTQRIVDLMNQNTMQDLRDQLTAAKGELSQAQQTNDIVSQLLPTPRPAYTVASPYQSQTMCGMNCNCGI